MKKIKNKKIVIIGGSSGIGLATAKLAVERGYRVIIASRSNEKLKRAVSEIHSSEVSSMPVDVTNELSIKKLFREVGAIDDLIIVGSEIEFGDFKTMPVEVMQASFNSKFFGAVRVVQAAMQYLNKEGSITLFSGSAGARPEIGTEVISAINSAVEGLSRALSLSLSPVRVNTIAPGVIDTPIYDGITREEKRKMFEGFTKNLPIKHAGNPGDVAEAALFLIKNKYTTGTTLYVDGGHALK